jgi:hypothetical protein
MMNLYTYTKHMNKKLYELTNSLKRIAYWDGGSIILGRREYLKH